MATQPGDRQAEDEDELLDLAAFADGRLDPDDHDGSPLLEPIWSRRRRRGGARARRVRQRPKLPSPGPAR